MVDNGGKSQIYKVLSKRYLNKKIFVAAGNTDVNIR